MYDVIARYYDELHAELLDDVPFVVELIEQEDGSVLDCGCGSGRLTLALARAGIDVTGVDNSDEMLAIAQAEIDQHSLGERAELISADIRSLNLPDTNFQTAVFSHNTAMHFDTSSLKQALVAVRKHLKAGGLLILDLANPFDMALVESQVDFTLERTLADGTEQHARWQQDDVARQLQVEWRYKLGDGETISAETTYHYPHPHELILITQSAGFIWETVLGDYNGSEFEEESERMIVLARAEK